MRLEKDSMGELPVPAEALYGASTQRAVLNFPISGRRLPEGFIRALGLVKLACAIANEEFGLLAPHKSRSIQQPMAGSRRISRSMFFRPAPARRPT